MNQSQLNYLAMANQVVLHVDSQPALWNGSAPIAGVINEIRAFVTALSQQGLTQSQRQTTGYTQNKEAQKDVMCKLALNLVFKLRGYAKVNKDNVLLQAVDYSESDLRRNPEMDVVNRCQTIHDKGREYLKKAAEYQLTSESLKAFQTAIDTFRPLTTQRDQISNSRTTITANIATILEQLRERLDMLDDLVNGLITDADFVATYRKSRTVGSGYLSKAKKDEGDKSTLVAAE